MSDETPDPINHSGTEDFDAFWSSLEPRGKTTTIMGDTVTLPDSLPLQFEMEARRLHRSKREEDVTKLVTILFGEKATKRWARRGMTLHQLMVLLAWAPQVISGVDVTLADVDAQVRAATTEKLSEPDPT